MKRTRLWQVVLVVVLALFSTAPRALSADSPSKSTECCSTVQMAIEAVAKIHRGMTRSEVEKSFVVDGGLFSRQQTRYSFRLCPLIKTDISFDLDPEKRGSFVTGSPNDVVSSVSKPYLEYPVKD